MARMVPFPMLPTTSAAERRLYEAFLEQLADDYVVYHSIDWVLGPSVPGGPPVQGEADFVIAHPVEGLLVLEVKGGELSYERTTKRWTQAGRTGRHFLDEDPFHQARDEMHSLIQILSHQPGWDRWRPSYGYGVALPDTIFTEDAHPAARAAWVIDRDDLPRLAQRVRAVMREWHHPGRRFGPEGMEALQTALGLRVELRAPLALPFDEEDQRILELTSDQSYVLSYVTKRHRAAVVGPAGSGKTILALQLATRLASGGNRTLLLCSNPQLAAALKQQAAGAARLDVFEFQGLCRDIAGAAGLPVPPEPKEEPAASRFREETLPALLDEAADRLGPRYDAMVIDEAQDLRPEWWPTLMKLHTRAQDGYLFVFADSNESLAGRAVPESLVDLTLPLPTNLRSTQPIHEFVSVFSGGTDRAQGRGAAGPPVEILGYRDGDELTHLLGSVLKNLELDGVSLDDVVVLTPSGAAESELRRRGRAGGYELSNSPAPGKVLACSIRDFRGLERAVVILAEIGQGGGDELARYLYLGGSRARNHLIVLAAEPVARELRRLVGLTTA